MKRKNLAAYKKMAKPGRKLWMEHGVLDYYECIWVMPFDLKRFTMGGFKVLVQS